MKTKTKIEQEVLKKKFWNKNIVPKDFNDEHFWVINEAIDFVCKQVKTKASQKIFTKKELKAFGDFIRKETIQQVEEVLDELRWIRVKEAECWINGVRTTIRMYPKNRMIDKEELKQKLKQEK